MDRVYKSIGSSNHGIGNRQEDDFYATDPKAVKMLLENETFSHNIWEPCSGQGHISNVLKDEGYEVRNSDLIKRTPDCEKKDFLYMNNDTWEGDIITNPPYKLALQFVKQSLCCIDEGHKVAMLLRLLFLEGKERGEFFKIAPPRYVYVSRSRISCGINGEFSNSAGAICFSWFIWEKGYTGDTIIKWFN